MECRDSGNVWSENSDGNGKSFVGFVQLFFDKSITILKCTALVAYYVQGVFWTRLLEERVCW